jgi:transcription elongation factor Elf1
MECPTCGQELAEITATVAGQAVTMGSCNTCDQRYWFRKGEQLDLRDVLDLTAEESREKSSRRGRR